MFQAPGLPKMSPDWIVRLIDERPGVSFLGEYALALRLISGLCSLGAVRARRDALRRRVDSDFRMSVLSNPEVRRFMSFLGEFAVDELPVVFEVIRNHLFPDAQVPCLFRAARTDPRVDCVEALRAAATDLRELELWAGQVLPQVDIPAVQFDRPQGPFDVEALMQCTLGLPQGVCPLLPSSLAGVYGPSCFGADLIDPDVPTNLQVHDMQACVHVFYRNKHMKSQVATYTVNSTGEQLIELLADQVREEAVNDGIRSLKGVLHLSGKRFALHPKKSLVQVLYPGECVLEVHFGKLDHDYAVTISTDSRRPRRSSRHTSHTESGTVKTDKSEKRAWHTHTRPVTPDRQPPETAPAATGALESETTKRRKHGWDPVGAPVADVSQSQSSGTGPRFTLSFQPPSGFASKHSPQLMRQLNFIQAKFPSTLREFSVVVLHQDLDPLYFSNVQDFGLVLSRIAIVTRLSLLSYGMHWTLQYDDFEVDASRTQATAFFRTVLQGDSGTPPLSGPGPQKDEGRSGRDPSRSRSPPAPSKPIRKVFGISGQSDVSGSVPKSRSLQHASHEPVCAAAKSPVGFSGDFDPTQIDPAEFLCSGVPNGPCSPSVSQVESKLSESVLEPWHVPSVPLPRRFSAKDSSMAEIANLGDGFDEFHAHQSACPCSTMIENTSETAAQTQGTRSHVESQIGDASDFVENDKVNRTPNNFTSVEVSISKDSLWKGKDDHKVVSHLQDGHALPRRGSPTWVSRDAHVVSMSTVLDSDADQHTDDSSPGEVKAGHQISGSQVSSADEPKVADAISDNEIFGGAIPAAQEFQTPSTVSAEELPAETCSPTLPWTQLPEDGPPFTVDLRCFGHVQGHMTPEDIFSAFRDAPVKVLGGIAGISLIFPEKIRVQLQAPDIGFIEGRAYMVRGGCCPACFSPISAGSWDCPLCSAPTTAFRLPPVPEFTQSSQVESLFFRYRSQSMLALQCAGPLTIHFRDVRLLAPGTIEAVTTEGRTVWIVASSFYDELWIPSIGESMCLFQGTCCGSFYDIPIFFVPPPGWGFALIRHPSPYSVPRSLEMFAGIGGWGQAIRALLGQDHPILSIEVDFEVAQALALTTDRTLLNIDQFIQEPHVEDAVVVADIMDNRWWHTTLTAPFTSLGWSPPCQPWSKAGKGLGLDHPFGRLLIHSIGIMFLFGISVGAMENVPGLVNHPHWKTVATLLKTLPTPSSVILNDLASLGCMSRLRCFLLFGSGHQVKSQKSQVRTPWWQVLGPLTDAVGLSHTRISEKVRQALSSRSLLPDTWRHAAFMEGIVDGKGILSLRVHREETLPTLVASYRRQSDLSPDHLCRKGVMTWLLPSPDHPEGVRFLDMFEGARALGFQTGLCLPADLDSAMMCVGNAVSPAQALLAFASVATPHLSSSELQSLIEVWLFRQVPLNQLTRQLRNMHWTLVDTRIERPMDVPAWKDWPLLVQAKLFPIPVDSTCLAHDRMNFAFLPSARPDGILECARVMNDRALVLCVRLRDFPVILIDGDIVVQVQWPSLHPLAGVHHLCTHTLSVPFDLPLWSWNTCAPIELAVKEDFRGLLSREILFTSAGGIRCWKYQPGITVFQAISTVFPFVFGTAPFVTSAHDGAVIGVHDMPLLGHAYSIEFYPQAFTLSPFGEMLLSPLTRIGEIQKQLALTYAAGRPIVQIFANGKKVDEEVTICAADSFGPLRVRIFGLPGGAPGSLSVVSEQMQSLLVGHGHPANTVKQQANHIIEKLGQKKCGQILEGKAPWPTLKHEATAAGMTLIPQEGRLSKETKRDLVFDQDPWAKYTASSSTSPQGTFNPKSRRPSTARVDLSFFHTKSQPLAQIDLSQLLQGWSGVHVVRYEDFADLETVTTANLCACASAVLVVGAAGEGIAKRFPAKAVKLLVPGWVQNQAVALRCTLIQTGDELVETKSTGELNFQEHAPMYAVAQVYVHKVEAQDKWNQLANDGLSPFLKQLGFPLDAVAQTWSQAFFRKGKKVGASDADYFFGYVKIEKSKLDTLLKLGGMSGFFPNPRGQDKGPDTRYRSVLLRGFSLQEARTVQATLPNSVGLTRSRLGIGVRVLSTDYKASKKKVFPQAVESSESEEGGTRRFQLLGVPDQCTRSTLKQALKALDWPAKVLRSTGVRAWSVTSAVSPPTRSFPLKDQVILVLEQEQRDNSDVVATTAKKIYTTVPKFPSNVQAGHVLPAQAPGVVPTKFEQLEKRVSDLAAQVTSSQETTSATLVTVQNKLQALDTKVNDQETRVDSKLEAMLEKLMTSQQNCFGQFERTNAKAIAELRNEYVTGYSELKEILSNSPKTRRVEEGAP